MSSMDPELRDKIIETHTLVKRIDEDHKEHKSIMNARLRDTNNRLEKHQIEVKGILKEHRACIDEVKEFRTKAVTYASVAAAFGAFLLEPIVLAIKKIIGI